MSNVTNGEALQRELDELLLSRTEKVLLAKKEWQVSPAAFFDQLIHALAVSEGSVVPVRTHPREEMGQLWLVSCHNGKVLVKDGAGADLLDVPAAALLDDVARALALFQKSYQTRAKSELAKMAAPLVFSGLLARVRQLKDPKQKAPRRADDFASWVTHATGKPLTFHFYTARVELEYPAERTLIRTLALLDDSDAAHGVMAGRHLILVVGSKAKHWVYFDTVLRDEADFSGDFVHEQISFLKANAAHGLWWVEGRYTQGGAL